VRIVRISVEEGFALAAALKMRTNLEGTYNLLKRPDTSDRYMLTPAAAHRGQYAAMTGADGRYGWVTLLQGFDDAVIVLEATQAPLKEPPAA
jgi:hypothetical protein